MLSNLYFSKSILFYLSNGYKPKEIAPMLQKIGRGRKLVVFRRK